MNKQSTYRPIVTRRLVALIISKGFVNNEGAKHGKFTRADSQYDIMVPRHKTISPGVSRQIVKDLIEKHQFEKEDIMKLY